jgi:hypothetical protein
MEKIEALKSVAVLCFIMLMINSCCKEVVFTPPYTLIGKWEISDVDSLYMVTGSAEDLYGHIAKLPVTGFVEFQADSSGFFDSSIRSIVGLDNDFTWHYSALWGRIDFRFNESEETYGIIISQLRDTVQFYFADYLNRNPIGVAYFYRIKLVKQN